jgi:YbbR domain-containing protein
MIRNFFTTNIWLKLASLILAIALWFFVISNSRSGIIMDVPIKFINIPPALEVVEAPKTVSVGIEGWERLLENLKQESISVVIDLSKSKTGKNFFSLSEENIKLPKTLLITSISPRTISLILEERLRKEVSVKPVIIGLPAEGFAVKDISVVPEKVMIEGPRSVITRIYKVKTEPVDITGIDKDLHYNTFLDLARSNVRINTHEVEVNVFVKKVK